MQSHEEEFRIATMCRVLNVSRSAYYQWRSQQASCSGRQHASDVVREILSAQNIRQSMSGNGNCYDNAITEIFFHTLKTELVYWERFETREEARRKLFEYIEVWYNRQRLHSSLGYKTPVEFERQYHAITN